jgi:hypothetical protein
VEILIGVLTYKLFFTSLIVFFSTDLALEYQHLCGEDTLYFSLKGKKNFIEVQELKNLASGKKVSNSLIALFMVH